MHESTSFRTASSPRPDLDFQDIINSAHIAVFTSTPEGRYISANPATAKILGYENPEDLIDSVTDIATQVYADPVDRGEFMRLIEEQGVVFNHECRFRRRDGTELWVSRNVRAIRDEDGQIVAYQGFNTDVTERRKAETQALNNARFLNSLLETVPIAVFHKDRDGRYQGFNKAFEEFSRKNREELIGKSVFDISTPDLAAIHHMKDTQLFESPGTQIYASKVKVTRGDVRDVIFHKASLTDEQGVVTGLIGAVLDISEDKRNEEALRESEERFRLAMDAVNDGLWDWNVETGRVYFSPGYWKILGYDPDGVSGVVHSWQSLIHPDDRERVLKINQRCIDGQSSDFAVEYRMCKASGDWMWILGRGKAIHRDSKGRALRMVGTHVDITERKQAEETLRASEAKVKSILEGVPVLQFVIDQDHRVISWNSAIEDYSGISATDIIGTDNHWSAFYPEKRPALADLLIDGKIEQIYQLYHGKIRQSRYLKGAYEATDFFPFMGASGAWLTFTAAPIRDAQGNVIGAVETLEDITERKRAEEEREILQTQLLQAQKMETVGRLAGGVAHDFNNMLGVILGYSEMTLEQVSPGQPMFKALHGIQQAAQRSAELTSQLLAFARKQTIAPKQIELNETVEGMLKMLRRLIGEDIDLIWLPGRHLHPVKMDPTQINQILANLCINARDAIEGVGKVTIETSNTVFDTEYCARHAGFLPGEYVLLAVSDNGCGMDRETVSHIFEPFFTTKEQGKGTGLGLASVYGAVKQNKGFINVYSEPGQGATFKIYLPRYAATTEPLLKHVPVKSAARGHETILLVEDEPAILKMTTMMLETLGYTVVAAATPGEAMRLAQEYSGRIDLLITDVVMPKMNGRDLAQNILSVYPDMKRLFMSGYTANVIVHHGILDEGVHFIQKPFSKNDLIVKVRKVLDRD